MEHPSYTDLFQEHIFSHSSIHNPCIAHISLAEHAPFSLSKGLPSLMNDSWCPSQCCHAAFIPFITCVCPYHALNVCFTFGSISPPSRPSSFHETPLYLYLPVLQCISIRLPKLISFIQNANSTPPCLDWIDQSCTIQIQHHSMPQN